jgi:hypothetical protein
MRYVAANTPGTDRSFEMTTTSFIQLLRRSTLRSLQPAAAVAASAMSILSTAGVSAQIFDFTGLDRGWRGPR